LRLSEHFFHCLFVFTRANLIICGYFLFSVFWLLFVLVKLPVQLE